MAKPTLHRIEGGHGFFYRVCLNGMCRDHHQAWQALVFYHQMLNQSTSPESLERDLRSMSLDD